MQANYLRLEIRNQPLPVRIYGNLDNYFRLEWKTLSI